MANPTTATRASVWRRLLRHPGAVVGGTILVLVIASALFAPLLTPYGPQDRVIRDRFQGPSREHLLGTDNFGRDSLTRILFGARVSLSVATAAVGIAAGIGILLGAVAGYLGGLTDQIIMRVVDVFLVAALGASATSVTVALGLVYWTAYARVIRSSILAWKQEDFVEASRALGAAWPRTLFRHLLPNAFGPIIVVASVGMGGAVTAEAALSFLGLGVQPPTPSWGSILNTGLQFLRQTAYLSTFPGAAIMVTVLGFNLLGDGLRDVLDPRETT
jgi:peptide/nickel transport system permease protein